VAICPNCGKENVEDAVFCAFCATPLAETSQTEERRFLTILFADLVGFTAESDEADPEDVRARLVPYHQRVREEIERYDGTVEKLIGDGVMAVFGAPTAHEDDPERAVRVALRIQDAVDELNEEHEGLDLSVRIGINTGEAVVTTGGQSERIVGDVVNTASRIESVAPPGGVVVGEATHRATELLIDYEDMEPVEVKGKSKPLAVWRAIEPRGRYGIDAAVRAPTPFLGRDSEMNVLTETFRRVIDDGTLQLVTIAAAPGVGKSRLVNEFWQWADDQPEIVWWRQGRCLPYGEGITFWALGEIVKGQAGIRESDSPEVAEQKLETALEALTADDADREWLSAQLGPLVGAESDLQETDRAEAFTAWRRFLEDLAAVQPLIMIVEDLHWADAALVEFLEDLLVWSADTPIMVICTARPELYETHPAWGGGQGNSATISLAPLTDEHIARLVAALLEQTVLPVETQQALLDRAGGNPLYAEEFVRMLNDRGMLHGRGELDAASQKSIPVPETVQALIGSRLDVLSHDENRAIENASVVGKVFWEGAIRALGDSDDVRGALRQLVAREWIRPVRNSSIEGEQEYAFWHALTRDVAYGRIPRAARAEKHFTMAEWIEHTAGERASDHAEMLAHHYVSALDIAEAAGVGDTALIKVQATRTLVMAGDRAQRLDAARASHYYEQALEHMDPARPDVMIKAGEAMVDAGIGSPIERYEEAAALAKANGDRLTAGYALRLLHLARWFASGAGAGTEAVDEAIDLLEQEPPSEQLADAYGTRAGNFMIRGELEEQLSWAQRAMDLNEELGLPKTARSYSIRGIARYHLGDTEGGMDDLRRSLAIAEASGGAIRQLGVAYVNLADHTWVDEGPAAAEEIYKTGTERVEARGGDHSWAKAEMMWTGFDLGDWDEVLARADGLLDQWEGKSVQYVPWAQSFRARVKVWRGEIAEAVALQDLYLPALREIEDLQVFTPALAVSAQIEAARGDSSAAVALLDEFISITEDKSTMYRALYVTDAVRLLVAAGELEKARQWVSGSTSFGLRNELSAATATAVVAEASGGIRDALGQYEQVATGWDDYGHVLEHALALYGAGRCLAELGRSTEATQRLAEARSLFADLGANPAVEEIDGIGDQAAAL